MKNSFEDLESPYLDDIPARAAPASELSNNLARAIDESPFANSVDFGGGGPGQPRWAEVFTNTDDDSAGEDVRSSEELESPQNAEDERHERVDDEYQGELLEPVASLEPETDDHLEFQGLDADFEIPASAEVTRVTLPRGESFLIVTEPRDRRIPRSRAWLTETADAASEERVQEEIHSTSFRRARNLTDGGRTGIEIEVTWQLVCTKETIDLKVFYQLFSRDNWSAFRRLIAPCEACSAFSSGLGVVGMTWDQAAHALREKNPHVWLTVEAGQWRAAETDLKRRVTFGTDLMDDLYFDDDSFTLLSNAYSVRGRKRWDNWRRTEAPVMRRILIGTKSDMGVVGGIKRGEKEDVRLDGNDATRAARTRLGDYIQSGFVDNDWGRRGRRAIHSIRAMYDDLRGRRALTSFTSGAHTDVLDLKPKAFIRSLRLRYHLREVTLSRLQEILNNGATILRALSANAAAKRSTLSSAQQVDADAFVKRVADTLDYSLVASRADKELRGLDASMRGTVRDLRPRASRDTPRNHLDLEKQRVVAETLSKLYHELAADVDKGGLLTAISGVSADNSAIWKRQIEAAGSAAVGLWFDRARRFYVPNSGRATAADFVIDTLDGSGMFTPDAWAGVAPADQTNQNDPDVQKLFHATLVNETQIELTRGVAYTRRIEQLTARRTPSPADVQNLKGAQFVLDKYVESMTILVEMKKDQISDGVDAAIRAAEARKDAVPKCTAWAWQAVTQGKGEAALSLLKGRAGP